MDTKSLIILIILFVILTIITYLRGYLEGRHDTEEMFYKVMDGIYNENVDRAKKDAIELDPVNQGYHQGVAKGSLLMMEVYYTLRSRKKGDDDEFSEQNSPIQLLLSKMQIRKNKGNG